MREVEKPLAPGRGRGSGVPPDRVRKPSRVHREQMCSMTSGKRRPAEAGVWLLKKLDFWKFGS